MADKTSPGEAVGKTDRPRNALKRGVFSNVLLADEDPQDVEVIVDDVIKRFEVEDSAGEICARRLVQTSMQIKRLNQAQLDYVEGYMQGESMRQEFCRQVGITTLSSKSLPSWYFVDDPDSREHARRLLRAVREALHLQTNYTVDRMIRVKELYPRLWRYLMGDEGSAVQKVHTFADRLAGLYKKATPHENLRELIDALKEKHNNDLLWAENEDRFDSVVRGLRGQALLDAMSNPNWARADSLFHRRSQDLLQTLVSLQHEKNRCKTPVLDAIEPTKDKKRSQRRDRALQTDGEVKQIE